MDNRKLCSSYGCNASAEVKIDDVPFDTGLRDYCEMNSCGCYNRSYACPPLCGDARECVERAKKYSTALVFQTVAALEDSFDFEGMTAAMINHRRVCSGIFRDFSAEHPDSLLLSAGSCNLCEEGCGALTGTPCRHPELASASVEAYCINVSALCEKTGMKYINGKDTVTYFGIILY